MEVIKHSAMELILQSNQKDIQRLEEERTWSVRFILGIVISFGLCLLLRASGGFLRGFFVLANFIGGMSTLALLTTISFTHSVKTCIMDRASDCVTIIEKVMWRWWTVDEEKYTFQDIQAVRLWKDHEGYVSFGLRPRSGKIVKLESTFPSTGIFTSALSKKVQTESVPAHTKSTSESAEVVSSFLNVPLQIDLGSEKIIKCPGALPTNAKAIPLSCSRCGGQLAPLHQGLSHVTCEYCGTTTLIIWENNDISMSTSNSIVGKQGTKAT
jgi:hypothetical protein